MSRFIVSEIETYPDNRLNMFSGEVSLGNRTEKFVASHDGKRLVVTVKEGSFSTPYAVDNGKVGDWGDVSGIIVKNLEGLLTDGYFSF